MLGMLSTAEEGRSIEVVFTQCVQDLEAKAKFTLCYIPMLRDFLPVR